ncbi:MAG: 2'-5' RNA ligase family protein [Thermomicrobiales bacterium]
MERQFGQTRAGKYMPHSTIGFFRSGMTVETIVAAIDPVLSGRSSFEVQNHGSMALGRSVVLDIHHADDGSPNPALLALHDDAFAALSPLMPRMGDRFDWTGGGFHAHLTMAQTITPLWLFDEVFAFLQEAEPIGPRRFLAEYVHLYAVRSDAWLDDNWSDSLTWELLHSWQLG